MIKEALKYLVDLGQVKTFDINGYTYSTHNLVRITPPEPKPLFINTLDGLIDFYNSEKDIIGNDVCIHIDSNSKVNLCSKLRKDMSRYVYACSQALTSTIKYAFYNDIEDFIIIMQTCFVQNEDAKKILKLVGNIKDENVKQYGDDGITQTVIAKTGIATVGNVVVPNPVTLAPYRTFPEISQPESKFVFRLKKDDRGIKAALFETDDMSWMLLAMDSIKAYLQSKLGEEIEIIR